MPLSYFSCDRFIDWMLLMFVLPLFVFLLCLPRSYFWGGTVSFQVTGYMLLFFHGFAIVPKDLWFKNGWWMKKMDDSKAARESDILSQENVTLNSRKMWHQKSYLWDMHMACKSIWHPHVSFFLLWRLCLWACHGHGKGEIWPICVCGWPGQRLRKVMP